MRRVLILTSSPYFPSRAAGSGGWVGALQQQLSARGLEVSLAYVTATAGTTNPAPAFHKYTDGPYTYYDIRSPRKSLWCRIVEGLRPSLMRYEHRRWAWHEAALLAAIADAKPDIVHVFGTEQYYALVADRCPCPCVVHLQGFLSVWRYALLPPGVSVSSYVRLSLSPRGMWHRYHELRAWERDAEREREAFRRCRHVLGRTEWDRAIAMLRAPQACYHHAGEMLRDDFYAQPERQRHDTFTIVTTISAPLYKGFDMLLRTASELREHMAFRWVVFGSPSTAVAERTTHLRAAEVGVEVHGRVSAAEIRRTLLAADVYMHPSYIENSPNSVGEAQMCALPIVATRVGGLDDIVAHGTNGYLVPANDPCAAAAAILQLARNPDKAEQMGQAARKAAERRHDRKAIVDETIALYSRLVV